jgi:hypothetical protein
VQNWLTSYLMTGLVFSTNDTYGAGTQILTMPYTSSSAAGLLWSVRGATNWSVAGTTYTSLPNLHIVNGPVYQRLVWTTTNTFEAYVSPDGVSWLRYPDATMALAITPTHVGLVHSHWAASIRTITTFEYFRVYN